MSSRERSLSARRDRAARGRPAPERDLRLRRHEHEPHPHRPRPHHRSSSTMSSPPALHRINHISGTKALSATIPPRLFLDGQEEARVAEARSLQGASSIPSGRRSASSRSKGGHGGMDYVMSWRLIQCMREGLVPDMDVYDAAAWSAPAPLSEQSVAQGARP